MFKIDCCLAEPDVHSEQPLNLVMIEIRIRMNEKSNDTSAKRERLIKIPFFSGTVSVPVLRFFCNCCCLRFCNCGIAAGVGGGAAAATASDGSAAAASDGSAAVANGIAAAGNIFFISFYLIFFIIFFQGFYPLSICVSGI
jgi:hypothetical protein